MQEKLSMIQLEEQLHELQSWNAMELMIQNREGTEGIDVFLPYVMNDAIECYLKLEASSVQGTWDTGWEGDVSFAFINSPEFVGSEAEKCGIVFRQGEERLITVWCRSAWKETHCYQYHQIGHMWRKKTGEEQWRRIVNLLCVIHDKYHYVGPHACNELELELYPLTEFQPVRSFTPINESIDGWYPETQDGINAMKAVCEAAGDTVVLDLVKKYETQILTGRRIKSISQKIQKLLQDYEHSGIYQLICQKLSEASLRWPERSYQKTHQQKINAARQQVELEHQRQGYSGSYPIFWRVSQKEKVDLEKTINSKTTVIEMLHYVEEQPFTIMEADDYNFRMYCMRSVSENRGQYVRQICGIPEIDFGFFSDKGFSGTAVKR